MFFYLSKILGFVSLPSNAIALICAAGAVLLLTPWQRAGRITVIAGVVLLLVCGFSPIGNALMLPLSERFPAWHANGHDPDGIIVLGGAIDAEASDARNEVELDASAERVLAMLQLARRFPNARIVFSGGSAAVFEKPVAEAPIAGRLLEEFGTDPSRIILESRSRTTAENARFVRELITPKPGERWLLVTSAFHMPRAVGVFRAAGFDVEAYPVDWRTRGWVDVTRPFGKLTFGLAQTNVAVHEWIGLLSYWLAGRSSALFPAPRS